MYILFWTLLIIILYSYLGYPLLLFIISSFSSLLKRNRVNKGLTENYEPPVTLFIAAYNEVDFIEKKIQNSLSLNYPKEKIQHIWVTDGSNDGTPEKLKEYSELEVYHENKRNGKIGAINRGMKFVKNPIIIFTDANSILNKESINQIVAEFKNQKAGCVAGRKRILIQSKDNAVNIGEGIYWKYESLIKKWESNINSALGAAGELFAIRTELFDEVDKDIILDDFVISLRIAQKGYKIKYIPKAFASERASINIKEELKRKTRIACGGFQAIFRLKGLLNPFQHPFLTFQYISHKIFRWFFVPISMFSLLFVIPFVAIHSQWNNLYSILLLLHTIFYIFVFIGFIFRSKKTNLKFFFTPYYIFIMNLSEIIGFIKFVLKIQSVNWERSKRE